MTDHGSTQSSQVDPVVLAGPSSGRPMPIYTLIGVLVLALLAALSLLRKPGSDSFSSQPHPVPAAGTAVR